MKKIFLLLFCFASTMLAACAPQVTVTSEVTVTFTPPPAMSTPTPIPISPTPEQPAETSLSPEQIAANVAEWNDEFKGAYTVTAEGEFKRVGADGQETAVPGFVYDAELNVLWLTKHSPWTNGDIHVPITLSDASPELKDGVPTGKIDFPACSFDGTRCTQEKVWFDGGQVETISKAEGILVLHTWMQEIYQRTLTEQGQAAADAILEQNSAVRAASNERADAYWTLAQSNGAIGYHVTMEDGTVWDTIDSAPYRWWSNEIPLTNQNGRFEEMLPVPFMTITSSDDSQTGLVLADKPGSGIQKLFIDQPFLYQFNYKDYAKTKLTKMQIPEAVWKEMVRLNGLTLAK